MKLSAARRSMGMPGTLRGGGAAVFEKSDRRDAGEVRDLGGHMRLIGVAGIEGQLDQRRRCKRLQPAEAQHTLKHLRPIAGRIAYAPVQLTCAEAKLGGDRADTRSRAPSAATAAHTSGSGSAARS